MSFRKTTVVIVVENEEVICDAGVITSDFNNVFASVHATND